MPALLITSVSPRQGKTAVAALLASRIASDGKSVGIATVDEGVVGPLSALLPGIAVRSGAPDAIRSAASEAGGDATIVEGLSGDVEGNRKIADELDARVIVVGELSDDLAGAALAYGDRAAGVIINNMPRYRSHELETTVRPAIEAAGVKFLGAIPEDRRLVTSTVRQISEHLGGRFTQWDEHSDELVDHVLLGGMVVDWGVHYFSSKENAVVMIRGDRPDIQMAALATPIKGLILTEGIEPLEYVHYEADQEEVPVTVVQAGTHDATARLETLLDTVQFDHPDKLARLQELAADTVDFEAIDEALALPVTG
ncbi:MAG: phosphotransacetylase family protein [Chloroflexi bacterium]|nr:phosphotransacetylase family protein [Chloroflexota bacterium]